MVEDGGRPVKVAQGPEPTVADRGNRNDKRVGDQTSHSITTSRSDPPDGWLR